MATQKKLGRVVGGQPSEFEMHARLIAFAFLAATATAHAQNEFTFADGSSGPTRASLGAAAGELLVQYSADVHRCIGNTLASGEAGPIVGMSALLQDQNGSSTESFAFLARPDLAGQPDCGSTLFVIDPLTVPSTGQPGPAAWVVRVTLAHPVAVPRDATWYAGIALPATPEWPFDGLGVVASSYCTPKPVPDFGYVLSSPCGLSATEPRTYHIRLLTAAPVLNIGVDASSGAPTCVPGPRFGPSGAYPDVFAGGDAIVLRVRAAPAANTDVVLLIGAGFPVASFPVPALGGSFALDPAIVLVAGSAALPPSGEVVIAPPFLAAGQIPIAVQGGQLAFQALTIGARMRLSNAERTLLQ